MSSVRSRLTPPLRVHRRKIASEMASEIFGKGEFVRD
jgi:hypothetical protein